MKNYVCKFKKVSEERFIEDMCKTFYLDKTDTIVGVLKDTYNKIQLPKRSTDGSAGYDFHIPFGIKMLPGDIIVIPTGIRCEIDDGWFLSLYPRSGLGFKYRTAMVNTIPVIDSDYYKADNEGHIMVKLSYDGCLENGIDISPFFSYDSNEGLNLGLIRENTISDKELILKQNDRFVQGVILQHGYDMNELKIEQLNSRTGGIGSTGLS